jgi:hypothetical protein
MEGRLRPPFVAGGHSVRVTIAPPPPVHVLAALFVLAPLELAACGWEDVPAGTDGAQVLAACLPGLEIQLEAVEQAMRRSASYDVSATPGS